MPTDAELDTLLDLLAARARARAGPLVNAAGDEVTPYASTGRLIVNPGDVIASVWGNTTYDQTVNCFDTAAARDSQIPTPHDGAVAYTIDTTTLWLRRAGAWVAVLAGPQFRYGARYALAATTSPATVNQTQQLNLGAKSYDQANAVSGNVYTCPAAGRYLMRVSASVPVAANIGVSVYLRKNGGNDTQAGLQIGASGIIIPTAVGLIMCAAGDTLDAAWQVGAASLVLRTATVESSFAVDYLGPA